MSSCSLTWPRRAPTLASEPFAVRGSAAIARARGEAGPCAYGPTDSRYWDAHWRGWWRRALVEVLVADLLVVLLGTGLLLLFS